MTPQKRSTRKPPQPHEPAPQVTPMPFPGESPTVSLALAAARMYGLPAEDDKPAKKATVKKAKRPVRKATAKKGAAARKAGAR